MKYSTIPALASAIVILGAAATASADVKDNWKNNCASCHGADGGGHTKAGRVNQVKDFTDAKVQSAFTDDQAFNQIKQGKKDETGKEKMKSFADKFTDPEVRELVAYVRAFQK